MTMRRTYELRDFAFTNAALAGWHQRIEDIRRIIVHRQGNPGATALNALNWGNSTAAFSIHDYVEDGVCYHAVKADRHAFHVTEHRLAEQRGFQVLAAGGIKRGDIDTIGIETVDVAGGAAGQIYSLSQQTRITLVLRLADWLRYLPQLTVEAISEHADWDTWQRPDDLGDALNIPDLREDVRDLIEGREPWRTVQEFATGMRAPESWRTGPQSPPIPALPVPETPAEAIARELRLLAERVAAL